RLVGDFFARRLDLAVAVAAVHRALAPGDERDLGHLAAFGARSRVHLARRRAAEAREVAVAHVTVVLLEPALAGAPRRAAGLAPCGLVHQALVGIELLLAGRENEHVSTVAARDLFVGKSQGAGSPVFRTMRVSHPS